MTQNNRIVLAILTVAAVFVIGSVLMNGVSSVSAQEAKFAVQGTAKSMQDPLPGHESHQIAIVLPPKDDGKMYSGTVTYVASQPVEVVVLHPFNASATDADHGEPLNAPFKDGKVAISVMKEFTGATNAGSLNFAGSALAFHTLDGEHFSVSYSIVGSVDTPTPVP